MKPIWQLTMVAAAARKSQQRPDEAAAALTSTVRRAGHTYVRTCRLGGGASARSVSGMVERGPVLRGALYGRQRARGMERARKGWAPSIGGQHAPYYSTNGGVRHMSARADGTRARRVSSSCAGRVGSLRVTSMRCGPARCRPRGGGAPAYTTTKIFT